MVREIRWAGVARAYIDQQVEFHAQKREVTEKKKKDMEMRLVRNKY